MTPACMRLYVDRCWPIEMVRGLVDGGLARHRVFGHLSGRRDRQHTSLASEDAKIDTMLNLLSERLRYHGDWRPVEGTDVPRPLADIGAQGFGDCKDFSAAAVAILRHAGMTAYPVFVERGRHAPTAP